MTPAEQVIYNFFQSVIKDMEKNHLWTNLLIVAFVILNSVLSFFGSLL